jgi:hypothetical protein
MTDVPTYEKKLPILLPFVVEAENFLERPRSLVKRWYRVFVEPSAATDVRGVEKK